MNKIIAKFGVFAVLAIALAFLAFPTAAFATGTVEVSTEQTFIPEGCENCQASPLVFKFEPDTILKVGDQMEFAITNHALLANDIDMIVGDDSAPGTPFNSLTFCDLIGVRQALVVPPQSSNASPLVYSGNVELYTTAGGVCFRLKGSAGTDKIMMTILGTPATAGTDGTLVSLWGTGANASEGTLEVFAASAQDGNLLLRVFDLETYTTGAAPYGPSIYLPEAGTTLNLGYNDEIDDPDDNSLCIDVSAEEVPGTYWAALGENVDMNVDSQGQYTFNNSPFSIAYITGSKSIERYTCEKLETGFVPLGFSATQDASGEDCEAFFNDRGIYTTYAGAGDGFCPNTHRCNKVLIYTEGEEELSSTKQYTAKFEILVNGEPGDNGVYWSSSTTNVPDFMTESSNSFMTLITDTSADQMSGDFTAYTAGGSEVPDGSMMSTGAFTGCDVPLASRAVILESEASVFSLTSAGVDNKIWLAIPPMIYRTGESSDAFQPGDVVSVQITIGEAPCGLWWNGEVEITEAVDSCTTAVSSTGGSLLYPYYPALNSPGGVLNIMTICNNSATAGTATIRLYEADSDAFLATVDVPARGVVQVNLGTFTTIPDYSQTAGSGTFGDAAFFGAVTTTFPTGGVAGIVQLSSGSSAAYDIEAKY